MNDKETLLDKAEANMRAALWLLTNESDDAMINFAAYHIQQSYELLYKHILEINGIKYSFKHDIQQLIDSCIENNLVFPYNSYIAENADVITNMESKTRYIKNYNVSLTTVKRALSSLKSLLETAQQLYTLPSLQELFLNNNITEPEETGLSDNVVIAKGYYPNESAKYFIMLTYK